MSRIFQIGFGDVLPDRQIIVGITEDETRLSGSQNKVAVDPAVDGQPDAGGADKAMHKGGTIQEVMVCFALNSYLKIRPSLFT